VLSGDEQIGDGMQGSGLMEKLVSHRFKTAQGRESYDIHGAKREFIFKIARVLEDKFGCQFSKLPVVGLEGIYWDCHRGDLLFAVCWDIWSGCFVAADSPEGDVYVIQIGEYLDQVLNEL
jgi:hypothetical protein